MNSSSFSEIMLEVGDESNSSNEHSLFSESYLPFEESDDKADNFEEMNDFWEESIVQPLESDEEADAFFWEYEFCMEDNALNVESFDVDDFDCWDWNIDSDSNCDLDNYKFCFLDDF